MVEDKARVELGMIKPTDLRPAPPRSVDALADLVSAAAPLFAPAFVFCRRADHLARDRRFRARARDGGLQHPRQRARLAARDRELAALLPPLLEEPPLRRREPADLLRRGRGMGLVAVATRHRRHRAGAARARARLARPARRARRARLSPGRPSRCSCAATPTPTCRGGTRSRPPRASSANGCSAASTSRTGRRGSSSTSSASRSSPTRDCG